MNTDWQSRMQTAEDMRRQLTDRAISDEGFRSFLLSDPKGAIAEELGIELPDAIDVKVHESDMSTLHLALPVAELSEEQLEGISGGFGVALCC